jgi:hypothetical protein
VVVGLEEVEAAGVVEVVEVVAGVSVFFTDVSTPSSFALSCASASSLACRPAAPVQYEFFTNCLQHLYPHLPFSQ